MASIKVLSNKNSYFGLVLICIIAVVISSCFGHRDNIRRALFFINTSEKDTADFIHLKQINKSLSIEILGEFHKITDSAYILFFQIGTYGSPDFNWQEMSINPDSAIISINDNKATSLFSNVKLPYSGNPWNALSLHIAAFKLSTLQKEAINTRILNFTISLDGYAFYNNKAIKIEPINVLDPWFSKIIQNTADNRSKID